MTNNTREKVASRLKKARLGAGLSQAQAAEMMSMHRPTVSEIEAGRRRVSVDEIAMFAEIYGVTVSWLSATVEETSEEDKILIAARELSNMDDDALEKLLTAIQMIKNKGNDK